MILLLYQIVQRIDRDARVETEKCFLHTSQTRIWLRFTSNELWYEVLKVVCNLFGILLCFRGFQKEKNNFGIWSMLNHLYTRHTSNSLLSLKSESKERKQRLLFDEGICILICFAGTAISSLGREGKRKLDREHYKGTHDHSIYKEGLPFRTPADWKKRIQTQPLRLREWSWSCRENINCRYSLGLAEVSHFGYAV